MRLRLNRGQTQFISGSLVAFIYLISYAIHAAIVGSFALPAGVLAILVPLAPAIDIVLSWAVHGLTTGDWSFPLPPVTVRAYRALRQKPTPPTIP